MIAHLLTVTELLMFSKVYSSANGYSHGRMN